MHPLAIIFVAWFHQLGLVVQRWSARAHAEQPLWQILDAYLIRTRRRLLRLIEQWQAGTLPAPRSRAPRPRAPGPRTPSPPVPRLPRARTWIVRRAGYHAAASTCQLQHMLDQDDLRRFLAEVPRAARLLRPLAHLLGLHPLPAPLALPPKPRPLKPEPPKPEAPKLPPLDLPRYIRAAARALRRFDRPSKKPALA